MASVRRRQEHFRIHRVRRVYDRAANKFSFYVAYETAAPITARTVVVAEAFGLGLDQERKFEVLDAELKIGPTDIVYVTGDSGSGKSILLKAIKKDLGDEVVDMSDVHVDPEKPLIETIGATVEEGLELLSKVGLNDAFLFLRTYDQLSDGQKYRYRLAKFMESKKQWWIIDEFAATLDRDTAKIIAFNLQKLARQQGKAVLAATTHRDLFEDLKPSVLVQKRFGKEIAISYYPNEPAAECSLAREMRIEPGTFKDWCQLSGFHYRSHNAGACRSVFCLRRGDELCGVIVYAYPPPSCGPRHLVLQSMPLKELNQKLSIISRIVIHPKYRTIGLGAYLIRETLQRAGTPYIEMVAVMAKYNPFAERAGMRRVSVQQPPEKALAFSKVLSALGFDLQLLGSERYVRSKLEGFKPAQMATLKEAFVRCDHPRLRKEIAALRHVPYGTTSAYAEGIRAADLSRLVKFVKIVGVLLQTKVYLFWSRESPTPSCA
jgi:ABC-type transport system involved in cytochrome c biogenesis ATPase subunit/GNAT superfamily N-acetyltransferase